jgi:hypothetical protein
LVVLNELHRHPKKDFLGRFSKKKEVVDRFDHELFVVFAVCEIEADFLDVFELQGASGGFRIEFEKNPEPFSLEFGEVFIERLDLADLGDGRKPDVRKVSEFYGNRDIFPFGNASEVRLFLKPESPFDIFGDPFGVSEDFGRRLPVEEFQMGIVSEQFSFDEPKLSLRVRIGRHVFELPSDRFDLRGDHADERKRPVLVERADGLHRRDLVDDFAKLLERRHLPVERTGPIFDCFGSGPLRLEGLHCRQFPRNRRMPSGEEP